MSGSQKVLKVFGVLELICAVINIVSAIQGAGAVMWGETVVSLLSAYLLFAAAKDTGKIMGAWIITLVSLILSVLSLILAISGGEGVMMVGTVIALVLNLIAFIAANNVKKQAGK